MDIELKYLDCIFQANKPYFFISEQFLDEQGEQNLQSSQNFLCFSEKSSNKQDSSSQQVDIVPLKMKVNGIKKNKIRKQKQAQIIIRQIPNQEDAIQLSTMFTINNKGIIKLGFQIEILSFGSQQTQLTNYLLNDQIFQVHLISAQKKPQISEEQALEYIMRTPCKHIQEAKNALQKYKLVKRQLTNIIDSIDNKQGQLQFINEEVLKHVQSCNQYIQQYAQDNKELMFSYLIGKTNFEIKDVEIVQAGYSKSFLELIGLNESSLSFLLMRNQKIDIVKDQDEMMKQSIKVFQDNIFDKKEIKFQFKVTTFDGFDIQIYVIKRQISPNYKAKKFSMLPIEYVFVVNEFDVELEDLQNLIQYRQKILSNRNELTFDEFINKEVSLLFENVEYSVYSQSLIEKFYQNNLDQLQIIKDLKIKYKKSKNN
ncbi:hypothetical protein TTHERM_001363578 (macronuclear) [Tetrahymena thermophila SB210]|uniref:Uncharacterized protein n=1 Tax=Tetrahymena thermophila (strain SB210) TaxID=312017 RepID=W7X1R8_TETTS|nr:hypothetical protein TTHERM_001363578 [Tetrahymena thermophila SB210]EWS71567.1 hypothetical protein TTHERM_001363578 [Tetrahymena thermophila SB210]|eukprot:XP_012655896.1 hypothetical protein TTHERM_001363578 [Tetrahymena thermophila SB210]